MSVPRRPLERPPTSPGAFIVEDILREYGLTQGELAAALGVSRRTISQIIHAQRGVSADMALRLARYTGGTPEFWLNVQMSWDLWHAEQAAQAELDKIKPRVA
jgi:addiction module HigA family antidote